MGQLCSKYGEMRAAHTTIWWIGCCNLQVTAVIQRLSSESSVCFRTNWDQRLMPVPHFRAPGSWISAISASHFSSGIKKWGRDMNQLYTLLLARLLLRDSVVSHAALRIKGLYTASQGSSMNSWPVPWSGGLWWSDRTLGFLPWFRPELF